MRPCKIVALVLTVTTLIPGSAHLPELSSKLGLDRDACFQNQQICRGWVLFEASTAAAIGASLALFFVWVFPTNRAIANWTIKPDD